MIVPFIIFHLFFEQTAPSTARQQQQPMTEYIMIIQIWMKFPDFSRIPGCLESGLAAGPEQIMPSVLHLNTWPAMNHARPPKH